MSENINGSAPVTAGSETSESSGALEQATQELVPGTEPLTEPEKKEQRKLLNKLKLKVDGEEYEEQLPFDIDEADEATIKYLQKQLQLSKMSQKRAQEASNSRNNLYAVINELKTNPRKVLSDPSIGVDLKQLAAQIINEEIELSQMSPEEKEMKEMRDELSRIKEEREREREEHKQREFSKIQEQQFDHYDTLFTKALDTSDLPKTPYVVQKMADYMLLGMEYGRDVTPEMVLPLVREDIQNDIKQMFGAMPDEVLESFIDKQFIDRVRKKNIAKGKAATPPIPLKSSIKDVVKDSDTVKKQEVKKNYRQAFGV